VAQALDGQQLDLAGLRRVQDGALRLDPAVDVAACRPGTGAGAELCLMPNAEAKALAMRATSWQCPRSAGRLAKRLWYRPCVAASRPRSAVSSCGAGDGMGAGLSGVVGHHRPAAGVFGHRRLGHAERCL
jgi:hypothetical protein